MTTLGVVQSVDVRAFPMEIAKQALQLAPALNMKHGIVGFSEAELKVKTILDVLSTYHNVTWPSTEALFNRHFNSVVRFIQLKEYSPLLKESIARQLLDHIAYFPAGDPRYLETLDEDERTNN